MKFWVDTIHLVGNRKLKKDIITQIKVFFLNFIVTQINLYLVGQKTMNQLNHQYLMDHVLGATYGWRTSLMTLGALAITGIIINQLENQVLVFR